MACYRKGATQSVKARAVALGEFYAVGYESSIFLSIATREKLSLAIRSYAQRVNKRNKEKGL